jgi:hypothetical protein
MAVVITVGGQTEAAILKGRLEAENIPVHLSYESTSLVYGFSSTNLGRVDIMVPAAFENAARIICGTEVDSGSPGAPGWPGDPGGPSVPGGEAA